MHGSYWDRFAQAFGGLGAPLRPSDQDIRFIEYAVAESARASRNGIRAVLLGVTPAIANLDWPQNSSLVAVDCSDAMARSVWPGNIDGRRWVVRGDWLAMPRRTSSCDIVVGDGSINCLEYPVGFRGLACVASAILSKDGRLILRCYLQLKNPESVESVFDEAVRGSIGSFHAFKLRLLMAAQRNVREGVVLSDVYQIWADRRAASKLPSGHGWENSAIETIGYYRGSTTRYTFATLDELRSMLLPLFEEVSVFWPTYELGERCPTVVLRPRSNQ